VVHDHRPARHYPRFWIWGPSSEPQRDFNPPDQCAAQRTLCNRPTACVRTSSACVLRLPDAAHHLHGQTQALPVPAQDASVHVRGLRPRGASARLAITPDRVWPSVVSHHVGAPFLVFRGSIPDLHVPRSTLHLNDYSFLCMTGGQSGSLFLDCIELAPTTPCRFIPAHGQPPSGYPPGKAQGLTWRYCTPTATTLRARTARRGGVAGRQVTVAPTMTWAILCLLRATQ